jgi:hypothetical protein
MAGLTFRVGGNGHEDADASHPLALLRLRCERPRAAEQRDELAPLARISQERFYNLLAVGEGDRCLKWVGVGPLMMSAVRPL